MMTNKSETVETKEIDEKASCLLPMKPRRAQAGETVNLRLPPSLRPPTLMIDLLFGALMLFAFQMGDPNVNSITSQDLKLPTSNLISAVSGKKLMTLKPIKGAASEWSYELEDGRRIKASEVSRIIDAKKRTAVLLIARDTSVEMALNAQTPLRVLGVKVGMAVLKHIGDQK